MSNFINESERQQLAAALLVKLRQLPGHAGAREVDVSAPALFNPGNLWTVTIYFKLVDERPVKLANIVLKAHVSQGLTLEGFNVMYRPAQRAGLGRLLHEWVVDRWVAHHKGASISLWVGPRDALNGAARFWDKLGYTATCRKGETDCRHSACQHAHVLEHGGPMSREYQV